MGEDGRALQHSTFVRGRLGVGHTFEDFNLSCNGAEGVACDIVCLFVFNSEVFQLEIHENQGPSEGNFQLVRFDEATVSVKGRQRGHTPYGDDVFEGVFELEGDGIVI